MVLAAAFAAACASAVAQAPQGVAPPAHGAIPPATSKKPATEQPKVDLNNASKAELMTLPSVGAAEADRIIAHRPYKSKTDVVTKAGLPEGVYVAIKRRAVINDMKKPPAKKADAKPTAAKQ